MYSKIPHLCISYIILWQISTNFIRFPRFLISILKPAPQNILSSKIHIAKGAWPQLIHAPLYIVYSTWMYLLFFSYSFHFPSCTDCTVTFDFFCYLFSVLVYDFLSLILSNTIMSFRVDCTFLSLGYLCECIACLWVYYISSCQNVNTFFK